MIDHPGDYLHALIEQPGEYLNICISEYLNI